MSAASGTNVLRWSALAVGVCYGFYHQRTINATQKKAAALHEYEHKKHLIEQAKAEYAKLKNPASAATSANTGLNQDPMDPKFDLEAFFEALMKQK